MTCTSLTQCNILNLQSSAIDEFNDIEFDDFNEFDQSQAAPQFTQAAQPPQQEEEAIEQDADLITICSKSPIAQLAHEIALAAQFPRNTAFLTMLSVFSGLCCRYANVSYKEIGTVPTSLYFCGEQPPATAKSRILNAPQAPIFTITGKERKEINERLEKAIADQDKEDITKEELAALKKQIAELKKAKEAIFSFITDATPEAIDMTLSETSGFFAIASAEQGAINSLFGLSYGDGKANNDIALKGYNGEFHNSKRKSRSCYQGFVCGSICVIAQEGMINNILKASDNTGVIERFILWSEGHLLGRRNHLLRHRPLESVINTYDDAAETIYKKIDTSKEYKDLVSLSLSSRSWKKIDKLRQEIEPTLANGAENSANLVRGVVGKIDMLIMKVASVLHLSIDQQSTLIHDDRVDEAIELARVYIKHVKGLMSDLSINALSIQERAILDYLRDGKPVAADKITQRLGRRKDFAENGKASRVNVQKYIEVLEEKDLIEQTNKNQEVSFYNKVFKIKK